MRLRNSIILLALISCLFHFSPQEANAAENKDIHEAESLEETEMNSEKGLSDKKQSEEKSEKEADALDDPKDDKINNETSDSEDKVEEGATEYEPKEVEKENSGQNETNGNEEKSEKNPSDEPENGEDVSDKSDKDDKDGNEEVRELKIKQIEKDGFQFGDRNKQVKEMKLALMSVGFGTHWKNPTTYFGRDTEKVVLEFQKYYGLIESGMGDKATLDKIEEVLSSPYQQGNRSSEIQNIKKELVVLGFATHWKNPTTYFGAETADVVREFQQKYGLAVSGIIDEITNQKIEELINQPLSYGVTRADVVEFKEDLMKLGFGTHWKNPTTYFGRDTEKVVLEFQKYYGLTENGMGDKATLEKMKEVLSSPYRQGKRSDEIQNIKLDLMALGFGIHWKNPTTYFGAETADVVREFQQKYGLAVNGIVDEKTLKNINEKSSGFLRLGQKSNTVKEMKKDLVTLGFADHWKNPTTYFGVETEEVVRNFQVYYGLPITGIVNKETGNKIDSILTSPLQFGASNAQVKELKQKLVKLGYGLNWRNPTKYYGSETVDEVRAFQRDHKLPISGIADELTIIKLDIELKNKRIESTTKYDITLEQALDIQMNQLQQTDKYRNDPAYVSANYVEIKNGIAKTTANLNVRAKSNASSHIFGVLPKGTVINIISKGSTWHQISYETWRNPTRADVKQYLNPDNNDEFQHLSLVDSINVSASELNNVLKGKGILAGLGQAFIDGGKRHSVNEIYLISHALLETGQGTSKLAKGIEVGKNKSGKLVLVTSSNRSNLTNIKTTYNMFGIGAADADPNRLGAIRAYEEGWFTPTAAVIGGAKFIANSYIHNSYNQNTLYKMRWNPANPGYPQYATDIGWATKQVTQIKNMYSLLDNPLLKFNYVKYK